MINKREGSVRHYVYLRGGLSASLCEPRTGEMPREPHAGELSREPRAGEWTREPRVGELPSWSGVVDSSRVMLGLGDSLASRDLVLQDRTLPSCHVSSLLIFIIAALHIGHSLSCDVQTEQKPL